MNPEAPRFSVGLVGQAVAQFERLTARAESLDLRDWLNAVYRQIIETLRASPREWGDPVWNRPGLQLVEYARVNFPDRLQVSYLGP